MNEYDKRQFDLMMKMIQLFNEGRLELPELINNLEALKNVLTVQYRAWNKLFMSYWANLEIVYAIALDEEKTHLDSDDQSIIIEAVENLKKLVELRLKDWVEPEF